MTISTISIPKALLLVAVATLPSFLVHGLPSGAGNCVGGRAAVGVTHMNVASVTEGTLDEGGFVFSLGGYELNGRDWADVKLPVGQDLTWQINATDRPMRGFLVRAEDRSDDAIVDTTEAFQEPAQESDGYQVAETVCINAYSVGGVTHVNNNQKRSVSGIFRLEQVVQELQIDITVVIKNRNDESIFYYAGFVVSFLDEDAIDNSDNEIDNDAEEGDSNPFNEDNDDGTGETSGQGFFDPGLGLPLLLRASSCSIGSPCGECMGDCNKNTHCEDDLECFFRPDDTIIPGCMGIGEPGKDYCYRPRNDTLRIRSAGCRKNMPCDACQGSCDTDDDCGDGLACFYRPDDTPVPGCNGNGIAGRNYCHVPPAVDDFILITRDTQCNRTHPCEVCEGHCRRDRHCSGRLQCFNRPGLTPVPGCSSSFLGVSGRNYCYDPMVNASLALRDSPCSEFMPCNECEGECSHFSQCAGTLECMRRSGDENVPGCGGQGTTGKDYCYDPEKENLADETDEPSSETTTAPSIEVFETGQSVLPPAPPTPTPTPPRPETAKSTPEPSPRPKPTSEPTQELIIDTETASTAKKPTLAPTSAPSPAPKTDEPTSSPIQKDASVAATDSPTSSPTPEPSPKPTSEPSPKPTSEPSPQPTRSTPKPTETPTLRPTRRPKPTPEPTTPPQPTPNPTAEPTPSPTDEEEEEVTDNRLPLTERNNPCTPQNPCDECVGDCQGDSDCAGSLQCFQRPDFTRVPGCRGRGVEGTDYCALNPSDNNNNAPEPTPANNNNPPTPIPTPPRPAPAPTQPPVPVFVDDNNEDNLSLQDRNVDCSESSRCGVCVGDCDNDDQCAGELRCFFRVGFENVPGCSGQGTFGKDYCAFDRSSGGGGGDGNDGGDTNAGAVLVTRNQVCTPTNPCGECQGDCDSNDECDGILQCFFRTGMENVPGCVGSGVPGRDYCAFNPNFKRRVRRRNA